MSFTRTPAGLVEKWRFHQLPTVWVEGDDDLAFYELPLRGAGCRMERLHGKENADALIKGLKTFNYPYVVVLDGDYAFLDRQRTPHRRVVRLQRYAVENYLWEPDDVNRACCRFARSEVEKDLCLDLMKDVQKQVDEHLRECVELDIAARLMITPPKVLPDRIEPLLENQSVSKISQTRADQARLAAKTLVDNSLAEQTRELLTRFLSSRSIMHILRGHLVLGLLRRVISEAVRSESTSAPVLHEKAVFEILIDRVWTLPLSADHRKLRNNLRRKVREARLELQKQRESGMS